NFTNRVLSLIDKYYEGKIPNPKIVNDSDNETLKEVVSLKNDMESNLNEFKFREALRNLIGIARLGNKHLADNEPWKIKNENPERVEQILKTSFEIVTYLAVLSEPFLPFTSEKLKKMIGLNKTGWSNLDNLGSEIDFNFTITNKEMLFRRIEGSEIEFQIDKLKKGL
ncbi:MAG: class I tRNA ligase family protein, partial [Cryomorphaceae bacterium]|nr:class I tRNA ligase family protein [Cryomorphaceae bacterium]